MTPIECLWYAARERERKRARKSWLARLEHIPAGAPCPAGVEPGSAPADTAGWTWMRWVERPAAPGYRIGCSGRWEYGRRATPQEIRDYLSACVRLGLLEHIEACEIQEFVCGGRPPTT